MMPELVLLCCCAARGSATVRTISRAGRCRPPGAMGDHGQELPATEDALFEDGSGAGEGELQQPGSA